MEQTDKSHKKKKSKRVRVQGRNPLPRREIHTNFVETQTDFHAPLESVETETQTDALAIVEIVVHTEEVFHPPQ